MSNIKWLAFAGRKYSGKSTAAERFFNENISALCHSDPPIRCRFQKFSGPIKAAGELLGIDTCFLYGDRKEDIIPGFGFTGRDFMIWYGQGLRAKFGDDIFVKSLDRRARIMAANSEPTLVIIIDDLRFIPEAKFVASNGGLIVRITRPDLPPQAEPVDESERGIGDFPGVIEITNHGSRQDMAAQISDLVLPRLFT